MRHDAPGSRPAATNLEDETYLDFVEGSRFFLSTQLGPQASKAMRAALDEAYATPETTPKTYRDIQDVVRSRPVTLMNHRIQRTTQEMIWKRTYDTLKARESDLVAELDRYDTLGPGSVQYDPNDAFPEYSKNVEYHLQKGGYAGTPLAGYIYHLGGNVFHSGLNEDSKANHTLVRGIPLPQDGQVRRVLELACAAGLSSLPLKQRFPQAEVWATDASAPMVRYAHKRAVDTGLDIHFKQMAAEDITFPDNSFDIVFVNILFHELPTKVSKRVISEVYRVLRPGGVFAVSDIKDHTHNADGAEQALAEYQHHWQVKYQGEIYHVQFWKHDLAGAMADAGFRNVDNNYSANDGVWQPNLVMPMRVGEK